MTVDCEYVNIFCQPKTWAKHFLQFVIPELELRVFGFGLLQFWKLLGILLKWGGGFPHCSTKSPVVGSPSVARSCPRKQITQRNEGMNAEDCLVRSTVWGCWCKIYSTLRLGDACWLCCGAVLVLVVLVVGFHYTCLKEPTPLRSNESPTVWKRLEIRDPQGLANMFMFSGTSWDF